ncbi:protein of unknown function [Ralstonia solanacearum CMR15]|nr:protein of unknown function [Ralstonia solanacearum CMR15]
MPDTPGGYPSAFSSDAGHRNPGARIRDALHPSAADHLFHPGLVNLAVSRRGGRAHFTMTLLNPATDMSHTTVLMLHPTRLAAEPSLEPLR